MCFSLQTPQVVPVFNAQPMFLPSPTATTAKMPAASPTARIVGRLQLSRPGQHAGDHQGLLDDNEGEADPWDDSSLIPQHPVVTMPPMPPPSMFPMTYPSAATYSMPMQAMVPTAVPLSAPMSLYVNTQQAATVAMQTPPIAMQHFTPTSPLSAHRRSPSPHARSPLRSPARALSPIPGNTGPGNTTPSHHPGPLSPHSASPKHRTQLPASPLRGRSASPTRRAALWPASLQRTQQPRVTYY